MSRMEAGEPRSLPRVGEQVCLAANLLPQVPTRMVAAHGLMAVGRQWSIPRLDGLPKQYRIFDGIEVAAKLSKTLISTGIASATGWVESGRDPFCFIEQALQARDLADGGPEIANELFTRLGLAARARTRGAASSQDSPRCSVCI